MTLETISVGTDFSQTSSVALRYASDIAQRTGTRLRIAHAYFSPASSYYPTDLLTGYVPKDEQKVRTSAERELQAQLSSVGVDPSSVEIDIEAGAAHEVLLKKSGPNDLLIVGHERRKALNRAFAGSVATRIVRLTEGPVLALPPTAGPGTPARILVCDDFSEQAGKAVNALAALSFLDGAQVEVVYVVEEPLEPFIVRADDSPKGADRHEALTTGFAQMLESRVSQYAEAHPGARWSSTVLSGARAADVLHEHATSSDAQLVTVASTGKDTVKRFLLGSTTEELLHRTEVPLLVAH